METGQIQIEEPSPDPSRKKKKSKKTKKSPEKANIEIGPLDETGNGTLDETSNSAKKRKKTQHKAAKQNKTKSHQENVKEDLDKNLSNSTEKKAGKSKMKKKKSKEKDEKQKCPCNDCNCQCHLDKKEDDTSQESKGSKKPKSKDLEAGSTKTSSSRKNNSKKMKHQHKSYLQKGGCGGYQPEGLNIEAENGQGQSDQKGEGSGQKAMSGSLHHDRPQGWNNYGPRPQQQWFNRGRNNNRPYPRGRGQYWRPNWNRPWTNYNQGNWSRQDQYNSHNYKAFERTSHTYSNDFHHNQSSGTQGGPFNVEKQWSSPTGNDGPGNENYLEPRNKYYSWRPGNGNINSNSGMDIWGSNNQNLDGSRNQDTKCGSLNYKDSSICDNGSLNGVKENSLPKRERSISLNLDKSSENEVPVPKKDNSNVSLKAMQIIDQIVNKKPSKVSGSRDLQSSSVGSDQEGAQQSAPACSSANKTTANASGRTNKVANNDNGVKGKFDQQREYRYGQRHDQERRQLDGPPARSPSWQVGSSASLNTQNSEVKKEFLKDSLDPVRQAKNFQYSAPLMDSSSDENQPDQCGENKVLNRLRFGSRSLSESQADDVIVELASPERQSQARHGSKFKVSLPKAGKSLKPGPLNKDYLTKLVNSPRSRKEQIQMAKMLKSHGKQHRPAFQKPSLHMSEQCSEQKQSNVSIDELPDDIRAQISQLIETDMNLNNEDPVELSDEAAKNGDIINLSSCDEEDEDDLDLIMLRDSPSTSPVAKEMLKSEECANKKSASQKPKETQKSRIVIDDSDDEKGEEKLSKQSSSMKRRRNLSEPSMPSTSSSHTEKPSKKKPRLQNVRDSRKDSEQTNVLVIAPEEDSTMDDSSKSQVCDVQETIYMVHPAKKITDHADDVAKNENDSQRLSDNEMEIKSPAAFSPSKVPSKSGSAPAVLSGNTDFSNKTKQAESQNRSSPPPVCQPCGTSDSPQPCNSDEWLCPPPSTDHASLSPTRMNCLLTVTDVAANDCMGQMLNLSLREEEIHLKLADVNKAIDKMQTLLKKTKEQLQRRLKQRDKLIAEEDELRNQRICLLKGAVEKRSTIQNPNTMDLSVHRGVLLEITPTAEAAEDSSVAQDLSENLETVKDGSQELSKELPQVKSDTTSHVLQVKCDESIPVMPNSDPNENSDPVVQKLLEVPIKTENSEPDSPAHLKGSKNEANGKVELSVETVSQNLQGSDSGLTKLCDSKSLKYLGSLNAKESDLVIKSLASSAGTSNQKIYTLSAADPLISLNRNTQGHGCSQSPARPKGDSEPFKFDFNVTVKTEKEEKSPSAGCELVSSVTEVTPGELASLGIALSPPNDSVKEKVNSVSASPSKSPDPSPDAETNPCDNTKSQKDKKPVRRKKLRSDTLRDSSSLSTEEESPGRSPRRKTRSSKKAKQESKKAPEKVEEKSNSSDVETKDTKDASDGLDTALPDATVNEGPSESDTEYSGEACPPKQFKGHLNTIHDMLIWDNWLLTASEDQSIIRFNMSTCEIAQLYTGHSKGVQVIRAHSVNNQTSGVSKVVLYSGSYDNNVITWDFETGEQKDCWAFTHRVHCIEINWDRMFIGLGDGRIITYSLSSGKVIDSFNCSKAAIRSIKSTKEGSRRVLVVASNDSSITIRDALSGLFIRSLIGHSKVPMCLQVSNPLVYSGGADQSLLVHDMNSGGLVQCFVQKRIVTSLVLHKNKIFAGGYEEVVRCFDIQTWNLLYIIYGERKGAITSLLHHHGKLYIGRKDGSLECVTLVEKAKYICKFGQCQLPLTTKDDLVTHINDYHIMPNQSVIRCLWNDCSQYIKKNKDALSHIMDHVATEYPENCREPLSEIATA